MKLITVVTLGLAAAAAAFAAPNPEHDAYFGERHIHTTASLWARAWKIADKNNHPGKFTAFRSYE